MRLEQLVESFGGCSPAEGLVVQSVRDNARLIGAMLGDPFTLEILAQQPGGVFIASALQRALWVTEMKFHRRIDLELCVLSHFRTLTPRRRAPKMSRKFLWSSPRSRRGRPLHHDRPVQVHFRAYRLFHGPPYAAGAKAW